MNKLSKWNYYWLKFYILWYCIINSRKRELYVGDKLVKKRVYPSWRWVLSIAMFETGKFTSQSSVENKNFFNMTVGSITQPYIDGSYGGESSNMARFKSVKKSVQAFFAWFNHYKLFDDLEVFATTPAFDGFPKYTYNTEDWVDQMSSRGYFTANRDVYNNGVWAMMSDARKATNPMILFVGVVSVLLVLLILLIRWIFKRKNPNKKRKAAKNAKYSTMAKAKRATYNNGYGGGWSQASKYRANMYKNTR